jgi:hypothetical protein
MKRDWDLIRQILLATERAQAHVKVSFEDMDDCTEEIFRHHTVLLTEAGLVHSMVLPRINMTVIESLTWEGHEFLDCIRHDATWNAIKSTAMEKIWDFLFAPLKRLNCIFLTQSFI